MRSKAVILREKSGALVAEAGRSHADEVGAALGRTLAPLLVAGETLPDLTLLLRLLGRLVERDLAVLVAADRAHEDERADDPPARERRDNAEQKVYGQLVLTRELVGAVHGKAAVAQLGFSGPTPDAPGAMVGLAEAVCRGLPKLSDKKPRTAAATLDIAALLGPLQEDLAELRTALAGVTREARELEVTTRDRSRALKTHDTTFRHTANTLEGLFGLAGETELAQKVRPSRRRPGTTHQQAEAKTDKADSGETAPR